MKPISTLMLRWRTVDLRTGEAGEAVRERSDVCAVPAAAVVGEAMVAIVLAAAVLEKFGGDSLAELKRNLRATSTSSPSGGGSGADGGGCSAGDSARFHGGGEEHRWPDSRPPPGLEFIDLDRRSPQAGRPSPEIFAEEGEAGLSPLEAEATRG
jgi:hypothetical protein